MAIAGTVIVGMAGLVFVPPAQAVEGGSADCDALEVALSAAAFDEFFLTVSGGTDTVVAPDPENGTNDGGLGGTIDVDGLGGSVSIELLNCESTRADDFLSADADIASGVVTLGGEEIVTLGLITSDALCPAAGTGAPTASASAALTVGGELIELSTPDELSATAFVDIAVAELIDGVITVTATTSASTTADSATATGLELAFEFSGSVFGGSVLLTLGTITFAETNCTVGQPDDDGADDDGTDDDGADDDGTDDDGTDDDGTDDDGTDDDGTDDDGTDDDGADDDGTDDDGTDDDGTDDDGTGPGGGDPNGTLPETGSETGQVAVLAFGTLLLGVAALALARRRRAA